MIIILITLLFVFNVFTLEVFPEIACIEMGFLRQHLIQILVFQPE